MGESYLTVARRAWRRPLKALGFQLERSSFVRRLGPISHYVNVRQSGVSHHALVSLVVAIAKPVVTDPDMSHAVVVMAYLEPEGVRFGSTRLWSARALPEAHAVLYAFGPDYFSQFTTLDQLADVIAAANAKHERIDEYLRGDDHTVIEPVIADLLGPAWHVRLKRNKAPSINQELLSMIEWHRHR